MKSSNTFLLAGALAIGLAACNNEQKSTSLADSMATDGTDTSMVATTTESTIIPGSYVDLKTGKKIYVIRDAGSGYATDSIAKVPVDFYINPTTMDTMDREGRVVNNMLIQQDGKWTIDETKVKVDGDEIKIKDGDSKLKIDGEESKLKDGSYKKKVDGADMKVKDGNSKVKIEDGEVKKKSNN